MAVDLTILVLLGLWLTITVVYATPWGERYRVKRVLLARLIPKYNFFAPIPGTHDFHLLYRDQLVDSDFGPWRECLDFTGKRRAVAPIWHPEKRPKKTLCDIAVTLTHEASHDPNLSKLSTPLSPAAQLCSRPTSFSAQYCEAVCLDRNLRFGS